MISARTGSSSTIANAASRSARGTRLRHTRRHYQPVAVFREHVSQVTRSRFRRLAASEQPRLTIRLRLVRVAQQLAPPRSRAPLRRVRFLLETPPTRPRLDQGPVHREVFIAQQLSRLPQHRLRKFWRDLSRHQPFRFFVNTVTSHTRSSISSPTNQRNSRL